MTGADTFNARRREMPGRRPGRPRLVPRIGRRSWMEPREEILDIAAGLFVDRGFAGTSTREIAEAVGIRRWIAPARCRAGASSEPDVRL